MRPSIHMLALGGVVGLASLWSATSALAAPIALQFNVHVDRLCDANAVCGAVSLEGTISYGFDDTIVGGFAFDLPDVSVRRTNFAGGAMIASGPFGDLANPFASETNQSSASIYVSEERQPIGSRFADSTAEDMRSHDVWTGLPDGGFRQESWFRQIQIARSHPSPIGGDGQANATAADFLDELAGGTLTFSWYTYAYTQNCDASGCATVVDPRGFYATGTATLVSPIPAVPEPATCLLVGTGLIGLARMRLPRAGQVQLRVRRIRG